MAIRIYNTMSRKKELFKPLRDGVVTFYSCGQTVYDDLHIGNARTYSNWDVVTRYLEWRGYHVIHVQNFTDVGHLTDDADAGEDKIEKRAKERKISPWELVDRQIEKYYRDTDELNIKRPNIMPRATSVIPEMIELIKRLFEKGYAYESGGNVYFDTSKFKDYGKLARLNLKEELAKARVEKDPNKRNYFDFALWLNYKKGNKIHIMNWDSPWGRGYPGWHLECSVMAMKFLGETIDIHGGGVDHIPVHHTNEIAQSEAATGKQFVRYWMHSEFITVNGEKMSKSKGNFFTARELIDKWGAMVVRYALVQAHYRKRVDFKEELLIDSKNNLEKINNIVARLRSRNNYGSMGIDDKIEELRNSFIEAMDDDFNTSQALKAIHSFIAFLNKNFDSLSEKASKKAADIIVELMGVLGIKLLDRKVDCEELEEIMKIIISIRNKLREKKMFDLSDEIRDRLKKVGIILNDNGKETTWTFS